MGLDGAKSTWVWGGCKGHRHHNGTTVGSQVGCRMPTPPRAYSPLRGLPGVSAGTTGCHHPPLPTGGKGLGVSLLPQKGWLSPPHPPQTKLPGSPEGQSLGVARR